MREKRERKKERDKEKETRREKEREQEVTRRQTPPPLPFSDMIAFSGERKERISK